MGDDRPSVYWDEAINKYVYRASALGSCTSALVMYRLDLARAPYPDWLMEKFKEGNHHEDASVNAVVDKFGLKLLKLSHLKLSHPTSRVTASPYAQVGLDGMRWMEKEEQWEMDIPVGPNAVVRVHPDAVGWQIIKHENGIDSTIPAVVEVKAVGPSYAAKLIDDSKNPAPSFDFPMYDWQLSCEMVGWQSRQSLRPQTELSPVKAFYGIGVKDPEDGMQLKEMHYRTFDSPPYSKADIVRRVMAVERTARMIEAGDMSYDQLVCSHKQFPCQFYQTDTCVAGSSDRNEGTAVKIGKADRELLDKMIDMWDNADGVEQSAKFSKLNLQDGIKAILERLGIDKYGRATWKKGTKKGVVDWGKIMGELDLKVDTEKYRKPSSDFNRVEITRKSDK